MRSFRLRLILTLIAGITLVSVASTYFEVLAHKHMLRKDLEQRTAWIGTSLQVEIEDVVAGNKVAAIKATLARENATEQTMGMAFYNPAGRLVASAGQQEVIAALPTGPVEKAMGHSAETSAFGHAGDTQWLEEVVPLHGDGRLIGTLVVLTDASYIRDEGTALWRRSFWRIVAFVVLIVGITLLMVRWFLMEPITKVVERLRGVRLGEADSLDEGGSMELGLFTPLAREVATMAESLMGARAAAAAEARLRDAGENVWTAERLAVHMRDRNGSSRIFVVSNREPYMHVRKGRETQCVVPPSGLVTAIEPVLRACDGVWVAHGSGNADALTVDSSDHLRVPPEDPRYTLRRVWLSNHEEEAYYDGFANEGLWPLCHIAHTRPTFRASDWQCYREVNEKFANAVLEEMEGSAEPVVFVQDFHLALVPSLVKAARPDARVAIFWHIPWPNPEAFGICPWQAELLDGLLGADLIGFHIPLHCNNFLSTVDRVLESRTDREHMTARRNGHTTTVRPYPVSVALDGSKPDRVKEDFGRPSISYSRDKLLDEFGVRCEILLLGVDRMDYTKGIVERMLAVEQLLEDHPFYRERVTLVQIAAPSRTRIPSYVELKFRVEEAAERINVRYETAHWRPIVLIERQCNHEEVDRWYRAADLCLVTSLHDGMNLVAKEYVAARDDEDGVLVLSKFTGAAVELRDALMVNPYDKEGVADAIHRGLEMERGERRMRMERMRRHVMEHNIYRWAARVLGDLRELRLENAETMESMPPTAEIVTMERKRRRRLA
jgi:alpha,alpha-trehalose-phosphate synthase [UDP-forming]